MLVSSASLDFNALYRQVRHWAFDAKLPDEFKWFYAVMSGIVFAKVDLVKFVVICNFLTGHYWVL
jgi:hypothetical protein